MPGTSGAPHTPEMNGVINNVFLHKKAALETAFKQRDWLRYIMLHERPHRFEALERIWGDVTRDRTRASLFIEVWTDSENLWQVRDIWEGLIEELEPEHFHVAMSDSDQESFHDFWYPLKVYRGGDPNYEQGLSYTLDRGKADWFARRGEREGEIFELTLDSQEDILFYYDGRGEAEVVIHPRVLW